MRDFQLYSTQDGKPCIQFSTGEMAVLSGELIQDHTFLAHPKGIDNLEYLTPAEKKEIKEAITARTVNDGIRIAFPFSSKN